MVTLSSTKVARIYNGKKITSLTSGVGKIGPVEFLKISLVAKIKENKLYNKMSL